MATVGVKGKSRSGQHFTFGESSKSLLRPLTFQSIALNDKLHNFNTKLCFY